MSISFVIIRLFQIWKKTCNNFADFSKKEYFLAHGRPKLVCVQFKGSQAQITIRNGYNSCKCMIKMIIIYDDCTINDRRPNQVKNQSICKYNTLLRWADGTNNYSKYFFFHNFLQNSLQYSSQFIFLFFFKQK